jgi:hypothetical protein
MKNVAFYLDLLVFLGAIPSISQPEIEAGWVLARLIGGRDDTLNRLPPRQYDLQPGRRPEDSSDSAEGTERTGGAESLRILLGFQDIFKQI